MESSVTTPLRDVINTEIGPDFYTQVRLEVVSRNDCQEELEELLREVQGDPVRAATLEDLLGRRRLAIATLSEGRGNPWAVHLLGRLLLEEGRNARALEVLEEGAKNFPDVHEIKPRLVEVRALNKHLDEARQLLKSLNLSADDAQLSYLEGVISERDGEYQRALRCYEKAAEKCPEETRYHFRLGYLHALHGDQERATEAYETCQRTTPVYARALINLGVLYEDQEKFEEAITCYRMVLESNPDHSRAKLYLEDAEASLDMYYDREKEKENSRRSQVLRMPVTDFELSIRSRNCLAKMNIHTLGDLIKKTEAELLSYKNFGETSLLEIKKILAQKGCRLGQGLAEKLSPTQLPDSEQARILNEPVIVLDLSSRALRCMDRLGIESVADLLQRTELQLISQKNFGMTSLNEVKTKLRERGLSLARG